jgi:hypothetical protein
MGYLGDENTKLFHVNAIVRHNKNVIMSLKNEEGIEMVQHEENITLLWTSYKERHGGVGGS